MCRPKGKELSKCDSAISSVGDAARGYSTNLCKTHCSIDSIGRCTFSKGGSSAISFCYCPADAEADAKAAADKAAAEAKAAALLKPYNTHAGSMCRGTDWHADEKTAASTLECATLCTNDATCTAYDFNDNNNKCFLHTTVVPEAEPASGVTCYIKKCTKYRPEPGQCRDQDNTSGRHSNYSGLSGVDECKARALRTVGAIAYEWRPEGRWGTPALCQVFHPAGDEGEDVIVTKGNGDVGHTCYVCDESSKLEKIAKVNCLGHSDVATEHTLDKQACQQACLDDSNCDVVSWKNNKCLMRSTDKHAAPKEGSWGGCGEEVWEKKTTHDHES